MPPPNKPTARPNKAGFFIVIGVINYNKKNVTKLRKKVPIYLAANK